jgi:type II secretory pathway component PulF
LVLAPVVVVAGVLISRVLRRIDPTTPFGRWWCATPIARAMMRARVAEVAGTLSRLQASGVPLTEALTVTAQAAGDPDLGRVLDDASAAVRRGDRLSASLATSSLLAPDFAQLLRLGEQSGELSTVLAKLAERYRAEAKRSGERLAAVLEPAAVVIMAILIGTVVMAAVLPLVALGNLV